MSLRDKALTGLGLVLATFGIVATIFWGVEGGLIILLLLGLLIFLLLILQRRQTARAQQRLLKLTEIVRDGVNETQNRERRDLILHKKLLAQIQAQQTGMERLNNKLDDAREKY